MRALTAPETRRELRALGLHRPSGVGFAVRSPARGTLYDWHAHDYHQVMYAVAGPSCLDTETGRHVVPQGGAAWIPARTMHRSLISGSDGASLFFAPAIVPDASRQVRMIGAGSLLQEMVLFAMRWPLGADAIDPMADSFLRTLAMFCGGELADQTPLPPHTNHPGVRRAMATATADLGAATQATAVAAAAMSERSFRRAFQRDIGVTWHAWLAETRMRTAMRLLAAGQRVTDVAADTGYASLSAFSKSFTRFAGEAPARFRQRHAVQRSHRLQQHAAIRTRRRDHAPGETGPRRR